MWKVVRVGAWVTRFVTNLRVREGERTTGPLKTKETQKQITFWLKKAQARHETSSVFQEDKLQLNLQRNKEDIYECRGRLQGMYPTYLPDQDQFTEKLVMNPHIRTLHGGVGLTMTKLRETYWIPRLRRLTRKVIKKCNGCKRFQAVALSTHPPAGNYKFPSERTVGSSAFSGDRSGLCGSNSISPSEKSREEIVYLSIHMQSVKSYSPRVTSGSNCDGIYS